jgi:phosphotransferase system HPr (HPr) family protein
MISRELTYEKGNFTAYDAEKVVKAASVFSCDMFLLSGQRRANMKSLIGLISTQLKSGEIFFLIADGRDEQTALDTIAELFSAI